MFENGGLVIAHSQAFSSEKRPQYFQMQKWNTNGLTVTPKPNGGLIIASFPDLHPCFGLEAGMGNEEIERV